MRRSALIAIAGVLVAAVLGSVLLGSPRVATLDFEAFYCAGNAVRVHADPYKTQPLHDCELSLRDKSFDLDPAITLPAPQPPYDLLAFSVLSRLPFTVAKSLWGAILGAALFASVLVLVRLSALTPTVVLCALLGTLIGPSLALGQIIPLYVLAVACAARFVQLGRYELAALAASASLIEPHLGAPLCVALAVWKPRTRLPLALSAGVLLLAAFAACGIAQCAEYATKVLPMHALAEAGADGQLSLTVVLHGLGLSDATAVALGNVSYIVMAIAGIIVARLAAQHFGDDAFIVAVPAATAVLGGSFVHSSDVVAAVPLALLVVRYSNAWPLAAGLGLAILAAWGAAPETVSGGIAWFAVSALAGAYVLWYTTRKQHLAIGFAAITFAAMLALGAANARAASMHVPAPAAQNSFDPNYPQASWAQAVRARFSTGSVSVWLSRLPAWTGLILVVGLAGTSPLSRRYSPSESV